MNQDNELCCKTPDSWMYGPAAENSYRNGPKKTRYAAT
jgi:hypothetical protein